MMMADGRGRSRSVAVGRGRTLSVAVGHGGMRGNLRVWSGEGRRQARRCCLRHSRAGGDGQRSLETKFLVVWSLCAWGFIELICRGRGGAVREEEQEVMQVPQRQPPPALVT